MARRAAPSLSLCTAADHLAPATRPPPCTRPRRNALARAQIFSPPYVFAQDRPKLLQAPQAVTFGERFEVSYDAVYRLVPVTAVRLMAPSATTHSTNMNQRAVGLRILANDVKRGVLTLQGPPNKNVAVPGA
jgi:hypothetical protein